MFGVLQNAAETHFDFDTLHPLSIRGTAGAVP